MSDSTINLVVGFDNYGDLQVLQDGLRGAAEIRIVSAQQDVQRLYDDAVNLEADAVLVCPDIAGYRHGLIDDRVMHAAKPAPVIGWRLPRDDRGQMMVSNEAKGVISLPMSGQGITRDLVLGQARRR